MSRVPADPEIAVTGNSWIGRGIGSIRTMVRESFASASQDIRLAAYSVNENPEELVRLLENQLIRGVRILLVINRFESQPNQAKKQLRELARRNSNFIIKDFNPRDHREDLHAKLIVIDREIAIVGSANLTWKGLVMNHELMVRLHGKLAEKIAELIDRLAQESDKIQTAEE
ncbi:MAG: phospholipase D family protein [Nitrososphaerota archaeon]|nr:phospholipase D family protein [Nitrososphaerota archaeon]